MNWYSKYQQTFIFNLVYIIYNYYFKLLNDVCDIIPRMFWILITHLFSFVVYFGIGKVKTSVLNDIYDISSLINCYNLLYLVVEILKQINSNQWVYIDELLIGIIMSTEKSLQWRTESNNKSDFFFFWKWNMY